VIRSVCRADLSRLDSRALQMVLEPTFAAKGACVSGARTYGVVRVGPAGCTVWHMCWH
jgi:hypothetical protein